jgi:hypothetical protein
MFNDIRNFYNNRVSPAIVFARKITILAGILFWEGLLIFFTGAAFICFIALTFPVWIVVIPISVKLNLSILGY